MVFASLLFVFFFLAANMITQIVIRPIKSRNIAMLIFSLIFYSWSGPKYLFLLLLMVLICWVGAIKIERSRTKKKRKRFLVYTVALCLIILGIFKYTGFVCTNLQNLFGFPKVIPEIVLPVGISFYTFQLVSYVVDVYRKEVRAQKKYWMLLLYASLFHQCIAGPIVRYQDVCDDLQSRKATLPEITAGISRFSVGLAKKAILANGCAAIADTFFECTNDQLAQLPAMGILLGIFAYTLQIYLDFSSYSDMAIGMGLMCGFHYLENFNYPYASKSAAEFWRRWHISLGSFFRDYVYIPLGGNQCSVPRQIFNIFVVWFLTGLWHGASWNFVLWGLFWGLLIGIERFALKEKVDRIDDRLRVLIMFVIAMFSWILFKFTDFQMLGTALKGIIGLNHNGFTNSTVGLTFKNNIFFLIFCVIAITPLGHRLHSALREGREKGGVLQLINGIWSVVHPVVLTMLAAMALAGDSYNPFLYFQF